MNTARLEADMPDGTTRTLKEEVLEPLGHLWTPGDHPHARVSLSVGTQHDFGRIKVTATVSYECDQKNAVVDAAGLAAFTKAVEFMGDSMELLVNAVDTTPEGAKTP